MTYGDVESRESFPEIARERPSALLCPPLSPKISRSRFNRAVWGQQLGRVWAPEGTRGEVGLLGLSSDQRRDLAALAGRRGRIRLFPSRRNPNRVGAAFSGLRTLLNWSTPQPEDAIANEAYRARADHRGRRDSWFRTETPSQVCLKQRHHHGPQSIGWLSIGQTRRPGECFAAGCASR